MTLVFPSGVGICQWGPKIREAPASSLSGDLAEPSTKRALEMFTLGTLDRGGKAAAIHTLLTTLSVVAFTIHAAPATQSVRRQSIGGANRMKGNDVGQLTRSPIHLLHRASQAVEDVFARDVKVERLTPRQLAVLMTVAENEGLSQTGIVDRTGVDRSTLADLVKRLKGRGLLQRQRSRQDARAYVVKLTEKGRRVLDTAAPVAKRVDQRVLDMLPGKRRDEFMNALASIVSALEPARQ